MLAAPCILHAMPLRSMSLNPKPLTALDNVGAPRSATRSDPGMWRPQGDESPAGAVKGLASRLLSKKKSSPTSDANGRGSAGPSRSSTVDEDEEEEEDGVDYGADTQVLESPLRSPRCWMKPRSVSRACFASLLDCSMAATT